jgi:NAD(P)-dependent dehydrogenase (short-subunit alcohol dehydrogenase family)
MKIAITGHTSGIGQACAQLLGQEHEILGLSRKNGYDIQDADHILSAAESADVLINNAYQGVDQCILLEKFFFAWQNEKKKIINIGSTCTRFSRAQKELDDQPWPYRDHKLALEKLFRKLFDIPSDCSIHLLTLGLVDTPMVEHLDQKKLSAGKIAAWVQEMIKDQDLKEITLYAK